MVRITIAEGTDGSTVRHLPGPVIRIGRDPASDVVLASGYVSGRHGELRFENGRWIYEDLATTNGSVIRRQGSLLRVDQEPDRRLPVRHDDTLLIGDPDRPLELVFGLSEAASAPATATPDRLLDSFPDALAETAVDLVSGLPHGFDREALLALHGLTSRLSAHLDPDEVLNAFTVAVMDAFRKASHVSVHLVGEQGAFCPAAARSRAGDCPPMPMSRAVRDRVLAGRRAVAFKHTDPGFDGSQSLHDSAIRAGACAPLWDGQQIIGLAQVDCRGGMLGAFDRRDLEVLAVFAHQAAMALRNARLHADLRRACEQSIRGLVRALEAKDAYTSGHSEAVADLCVVTATCLGLPAEQVETIRRAALLHDIGKIGIPYDVLNKQGRLTPDEFRLLRTHPEVGARILEPFAFLADLVPIVLHHHERWDGRGYPAGLAGEDIPLGARVLSVVDTYHALVSDRAYRPGVGTLLAVGEMRRCRGSQFDTAVVDGLLEALGVSEGAQRGEAPLRDARDSSEHPGELVGAGRTER